MTRCLAAIKTTLLLIFTLSTGILCGAEPASQPQTVRLLTVGNSFAENAAKYLPAIFKADPTVDLVLGKANIGGCTLERHWKYASAEGDEAKRYRLVRDGKATPATLSQVLADKPWDVVTLQQMSAESWRPERYHPYVENLVALIHKQAPQATIAFHQTWAYRVDAPLLAEWKISQGEMYDKLNAAYGAVARQFHCPVIPSGAAIQAYRTREDRHFAPDAAFDFKNPPAKGLPRQDHSLVVGWYRKGEKLGLDFKHMNNNGCYLVAAVWYEALTGHDIRKNSFPPPEIPEAEWKLLQEVAHQTVAAYKQPAVALPVMKANGGK